MTPSQTFTVTFTGGFWRDPSRTLHGLHASHGLARLLTFTQTFTGFTRGDLHVSPPLLTGGERGPGPRWQRPGRYFCPTHHHVILSSMPGCPRCIADAQDDPEQESLL